MPISILAIDDDPLFLKSMQSYLECEDYAVTTLSNPLHALEILDKNSYACVLLDIHMPGIDGIELLRQFQRKNPRLPVIIISGRSKISQAVEAIQLGAYDFIEKDFEPERLLITIRNAIEKGKWLLEKSSLISELSSQTGIIAKSEAMRQICSAISQIAETKAKVLILGETGTGKELVARALHFKSERASKPYIRVNCASIPDQLLESTLFGHRKGSFTGAVKDQTGKIQAADGGTLFMDEIGDMALPLQAKLLHFLEEGHIEIVGEAHSQPVDARVIAATNRDLQELIKSGQFREDLYHRLNIIQVYIPPLRERTDDIIPLAEHFLSALSDTYNKQIPQLSQRCKNILLHFDWPGNVRQLRNVIERLVVLNNKPMIKAADLIRILPGNVPDSISDNSPQTLHEKMAAEESSIILETLESTNWKMQESARILGIDRSALFKKMKRLGIKKPGNNPSNG